jgi:hypothetical protein
MYRINYTPTPVLITVDEVLTLAPIDQNADIRYLKSSILIAEQRFVMPVLGSVMYQDLVSQKNVQVTSGNQSSLLTSINASLAQYGKNPITLAELPVGTWVNAIEQTNTTNGNYAQLWTSYLWQVCAECVTMMSLPHTWARSNAQGVQNNNPKTLGSDGQGSASVSRKDMEFLINDFLQSRINPLIAAMQLWICQTGGFTKFSGNCNHIMGLDRKQIGGIVMGIYKDYNPNGADLWMIGNRYGGANSVLEYFDCNCDNNNYNNE